MSLTAVGVHIFAGSFIIGIQRAGFEVKAMYENLGLGLETARHNFSFPIIYPKNKWGSYLPKNINLVVANPPCSAFSVMGANRGSHDPINNCMYECADIAMALDTDIFIMESVPGLWNKGQDILADLDSIFHEYQHTYLFSDSVLHGSPQIRPRFHYIASKYDFKLAKFNPMPVPTIKDAIWDLQFIAEGEFLNHDKTKFTGQVASIAKYIPPGFTASEIWRRLPSARDNLYGQPFGPTRRASWRSPGPTITGGPTIIHPSFDRFLTVREEARIFGYGDEFEFIGNVGNQYAQAGKAVTCFMGEWLGASARRTLQRESNPRRGKQFIDLRPYAEYAKNLRIMDWFGSLDRTEKRKLIEENFNG